MSSLCFDALHLRYGLYRLFAVILAVCYAPLAQAGTAQIAKKLAEQVSVPLVQTGTRDCSKMMSELDAEKPDRTMIRDAQVELVELGYNTGAIDGVLGPQTRLALALFCGDATYAVMNDLLDTLRNHIKIVQVYPDWRQTLASREFTSWMNTQQDASVIRRVRDYGNAEEVIELLRRYDGRSDLSKQPKSDKDVAVSYTLTADDFVQLKSRELVLEQFGKLLTETYAGKNAFEAAAATALKGVPNYHDYVDLAKGYGHQLVGYRISAASFKELKVAGVPDYVLQAIQDIQDEIYPNGGLDAAIGAALDKLDERTMAFKPDLVKLAEITPTGASLTENSLTQFSAGKQDDPLVAVILPLLEELKGIKYKDDKALAWAMKKVLMEISGEIRDSRAAILDYAELVSGYGFGAADVRQIRRALEQEIVPGPCLDMIASIEGADYPVPELFVQAVYAKLRMAGSNNIYRRAVFEAVDTQGIVVPDPSTGAVKLDQKLLEAIKSKKVPAVVIEGLSELKQSFRDKEAFRKAVEEQLNVIGNKLQDKYKTYENQLVGQAHKLHPYKAGKIEWDGQSCNCVHDSLAGEVYGFYPYWFAGTKQAIDFSVFKRIDYFGLDFNDEGKVLQPERWSQADPEFIKEARKYGSKVDLVIYRSEWGNWSSLSAENKVEAFKTLATQIESLLTIRLDDLASRAKPYISFGTHPEPIRGDGVTLYFDGYPGDPESIDAFNAFIRELGNKLGKDGHRFFVNLMFRSANIGTGIYDYDKLLALMVDIRESGKNLDGKLLVLMQEPTTDDKKDLRQKIEDGLHGPNRMKMLRDIVMVISYDGVSRNQLADDVNYANDNFGGIGFWPQPVASGKQIPAKGDVSLELHKNYLQTNAEFSSQLGVCRYICPNRWLFRLAWDLFAILMLTAVILYMRNCTWRSRVEQNFLRVILLLVIPFSGLTFALLFCDPAWKNISRGNGLTIMMAVAIISYSIWNYRDKKQKANLP